MKIISAIMQRFSIKEFLPDNVSREQINRILEAGRLAPSAKNRQAWRFIVITEEALKQAIQGVSFDEDAISKSPVIIIMCTTNIDYYMPNGEASYLVDMGIAAGFMMLQATEENLASCLITTFKQEKLCSLLRIPHSMRIIGFLLVGHTRIKKRIRNRLPLSRIVSYEHW